MMIGKYTGHTRISSPYQFSIMHNAFIIIRDSKVISMCLLEVVQIIWIYILPDNLDMFISINSGLLVTESDGVSYFMQDHSFLQEKLYKNA